MINILLFLFRKDIYNKMTYGVFLIGVALIAASYQTEFWQYINIVIDNGNQTFDFVPSGGLDWILLIVGVTFIIISFGVLLFRKNITKWADNFSKEKLYVIKHQGLEGITLPSFNNDIAGKNFSNYRIKVLKADERKYKDKIPDKGILKSQNKVINQINKIDSQSPESKIAYFGIARIPMTFRIGAFLGDNRIVFPFDFIRQQNSWTQLQYNTDIELNNSDTNFDINKSDILNEESSDVVLSISVSYSVNTDDISEVLNSPYKIYSLQMPDIGNGLIDRLKTADQFQLLANQYRSVLDEISRESNVKNIHLFYAGPNSLALRFGQLHSRSIHSNIIVYNYNRNHTPSFSWSYNVSENRIFKT